MTTVIQRHCIVVIALAVGECKAKRLPEQHRQMNLSFSLLFQIQNYHPTCAKRREIFHLVS